jgi:hypothetical protein
VAKVDNLIVGCEQKAKDKNGIITYGFARDYILDEFVLNENKFVLSWVKLNRWVYGYSCLYEKLVKLQLDCICSLREDWSS